MRRSTLLGLLGAAIFVAGLVLALVTPASAGWTAYTPLSGASFSSGVMVMDRTDLWAMAASALGLAVLAGTVGYRLGRRRARCRD
ncbi:hypothetical protein [Georgenia deserti]|uniref:LPXTG cell wall anchor domain-containing protein n=1 Tax=Georgenia deserti TaxID=2093781 RepID=A0ABW4L4S8_9MICO